MLRGIYTSLSGIAAAMAHTNVVADNLANLNTTGFRAGRTGQAAFELELTLMRGSDPATLGLGTYATGPVVDGTQGAIRVTGLATDLAIEGDGLFAVGTPQGVAYTRAGDFVLDAGGLLCTQQGYPVLDTSGRPVRWTPTSVVASDGSIIGSDQRLALVAWPADGVTRPRGHAAWHRRRGSRSERHDPTGRARGEQRGPHAGDDLALEVGACLQRQGDDDPGLDARPHHRARQGEVTARAG
jgi:flagellar hook-basal body protein